MDHAGITRAMLLDHFTTHVDEHVGAMILDEFYWYLIS